MTDNTNTDALIERLRATEPLGMLSGCMDTVRPINPDGPEAADLIDTLRTENASLTAKLEKVEKWAQGEVIAVLDREAATTARYDAKLDALEAEIARWKEQSDDWQKRGWELGKKCDELEAENARMRDGVGPDDPAGCPGGQGASCCGYHEVCRTALETDNDEMH